MTVTGIPFMRPMWYEFSHNSVTYDMNSQFMIGDSILFAPKVTLVTANE